MTAPLITHWPAPVLPTESTLRQFCADEGLKPYPWSNEPHDVYPAHMHSYAKIIYIVHGSITFGLPDLGQSITLKAGDRLDLPANTLLNAVVGPQGVVCLEAHI